MQQKSRKKEVGCVILIIINPTKVCLMIQGREIIQTETLKSERRQQQINKRPYCTEFAYDLVLKLRKSPHIVTPIEHFAFII